MGRNGSELLPPGPKAPPAVNLLRLLERPLPSLLGWRERYGDLFTVRYPLFGTGVYVCDPDAIRGLLTGDQSDLLAGEANAPLSPVLGERSVLILDGREHLRQRRLLLPPFQGTAIDGFRQVIRDVTEAELGRWREGETVVLRDRMRALTFEVIARAVFGIAEPVRIERLRQALAAVIEMQMVFFLPAAMRHDLGPWSPWGQFRRRLAAADALVYEEIRRRRAQADLDQRGDVLSLLLRARDEDGGEMSDVELREDLYPEPLRFRPERFLEGEARPYSWLPFGGGIRRCIGAALAQAEMAEVIRTVVSRVEIEPVRPGREPVVLRGITMVPRHGTPVTVRRAARSSPAPPLLAAAR